ncbi:MAG: sulfur oxidation c-type cytochrome SoxX [Hydrogenovibrio sp.]|uniref:sulfur oxidation c-type cytochrome SoxX n=1 Tax=Hydrogenovibrio sp. TaxID=2065821 RepID=UPI00286FC47F|nr:sulfur oxidation c-type cytochrome SoxX [Hydrogenovibrio sp.]MDR9498953.1 sulfur oxidation c-type cytochrome SoxX [Hydrogenovibrio sp.]
MLKMKMKQFLTAVAVSSACVAAPSVAFADNHGASAIEEGKELAFARSSGNCLACHMIQGANMPGNIGPALVAMEMRYPDKQKLYDKIWGTPETVVEDSMMPHFGANGILSDEEIQKITDYIYTL